MAEAFFTCLSGYFGVAKARGRRTPQDISRDAMAKAVPKVLSESSERAGWLRLAEALRTAGL
jgi:hypothetical protein